MNSRLRAFERKIGAATRITSEAYRVYGECDPELASRFGAKNSGRAYGYAKSQTREVRES
jgi:hypothetical protein